MEYYAYEDLTNIEFSFDDISKDMYKYFEDLFSLSDP